METAKSLRLIGIHGTGVDDVDMAAAGRRGIQVFSVPHQNSRSVAEMNVALMLALGRKIGPGGPDIEGTGRSIRGGKYRKSGI